MSANLAAGCVWEQCTSHSDATLGACLVACWCLVQTPKSLGQVTRVFLAKQMSGCRKDCILVL